MLEKRPLMMAAAAEVSACVFKQLCCVSEECFFEVCVYFPPHFHTRANIERRLDCEMDQVQLLRGSC